MDLAKIESLNFSLNQDFFDITKTIKASFKTLNYYAQQKKITPQLLIAKDIEPFFKNIYGDDARFS